MSARRQAPRKQSPRKTLEQLTEQLAAGWPDGLTLLTGEDLYHLDLGRVELLDGLVPEEDREYGLSIYADDKVDVSEVVSAARSVGMFAPRRVVLVRRLEILDGEPDALVAYAEAPPPNSHLIVQAPQLDQRRKLHKSLLAHGHVLRFDPLDPSDSRAWVAELKEQAGQRGLELSREAAAFLAEICGGDWHRLATELDKLALYHTEGGKVPLSEVRELASGSALLSGWEVADAMLARDAPAALHALRDLIDGGEEPIRILGGISWRARTMLQARAMLDAGAREHDVVRATRSYPYREALMRGVRAYRLDELLAFPARLLHADRTLKSRQVDTRAVMESLVVDLIQPRRAPSP